MIFASLIFLYLFLPLFFLFYFIFYKKIEIQNIIICIFSLIFYAWGEPRYILLLVISIIVNYFIGLNIVSKRKKNKPLFIFGIAFNILIIFIFKYLNLFIEILFNIHIVGFKTNILLPIGISFYTFQLLSYLIDVYRLDVEPQKKFMNLLLYISMFPQLIAGPIVRYKTIEENIYDRKYDYKIIYNGIKKLIIGLGKKVILANQLSIIVENLFSRNFFEISITGKFIGIFIFFLELYFDFSGYSDIAIGIGKIIGFKFEENFNYPILASSISEFWRRWHMSLGTFFRDYVYISLGGNRKNQIFNIAIVWILTGVWHGAKLNYFLWGIVLAIIIIFEKYVLKIEKNNKFIILKRIYFFIFLVLSFAIFYFEDISMLGNYFNIFGNNFFLFDFDTNMYITNNIFVILLAIFASTPIFNMCINYLRYKTSSSKSLSIIYNVMLCIFLVFVLVLSTVLLVGETNNPFLYMRF